MLSSQDGPHSILQAAHTQFRGWEGPGLANNAQCPLPPTCSIRAPLTRLPRDRGNGGSQSREGSRPAQSRVLGLNLVHSDPELQTCQLPPFPAGTCICFKNLMWADMEISKLALKVAVWCLSVSRSLLLKSIQRINISALFPIPLLPEVGCL